MQSFKIGIFESYLVEDFNPWLRVSIQKCDRKGLHPKKRVFNVLTHREMRIEASVLFVLMLHFSSLHVFCLREIQDEKKANDETAKKK